MISLDGNGCATCAEVKLFDHALRMGEVWDLAAALLPSHANAP